MNDMNAQNIVNELRSIRQAQSDQARALEKIAVALSKIASQQH